MIHARKANAYCYYEELKHMHKQLSMLYGLIFINHNPIEAIV